MNPLYNKLVRHAIPSEEIGMIMKQIKDFQQTFTGDPKSEIQKMMVSGVLSQKQFNEYAQIATQLMSIIPKC